MKDQIEQAIDEILEDKEVNQAKIASQLEEFENELKSLISQYPEIAAVNVLSRNLQPTQGKIVVDFKLNQGYELTYSDALEHPATRRYDRGGSPITGKGYEVVYWLKQNLFLLPIGLVQNKYAAEMRQSTYQNAASTLLSTFIKYCVKETGRVEDSIEKGIDQVVSEGTDSKVKTIINFFKKEGYSGNELARAMLDEIEGMRGDLSFVQNGVYDGDLAEKYSWGEFKEALKDMQENDPESFSEVWNLYVKSESKLRNPETGKVHNPSYYPNKETGTTRVSIQNAIFLKKMRGIPDTLTLKYDPEALNWYTVTAKWANGSSHVFTGLSWGYRGEGPHGLAEVFKLFDVSSLVDIDEISQWENNKLWTKTIVLR